MEDRQYREDGRTLLRFDNLSQIVLCEFVNNYITWGAGPRASQYLILGAKARAVLQGRYYVACEDIRALASSVLRHRIMLNFSAEAEGITPDSVIEKIVKTVLEPVG